MNLKVNVEKLNVIWNSATIEKGQVEAAYRDDSRELVVIFEPPPQQIEISTDEGSATLQIHQVEVHLSDEVIRHLAASLPSDLLKQ